jgi:triosephosphate isomerase (TIM)
MRKKIVAGNWKMNKSVQEGIDLIQDFKKLIKNRPVKDVNIVIAPSFIHLTEFSKILQGDAWLGAQNCSAEESGAFTGEVSPAMLKSAGVEYVIIGHSERRLYFHETDLDINKKVKIVLKHGLTPIFCCGEKLYEREKGLHIEIVRQQVDKGLFDLSPEDFSKVVLAYEPVWAIGTGKTATPDQAQEMHKYIRNLIEQMYGKSMAEMTTILYGGSCKASNAGELFSNPDVDGGLIGGASLDAVEFIEIIHAL